MLTSIVADTRSAANAPPPAMTQLIIAGMSTALMAIAPIDAYQTDSARLGSVAAPRAASLSQVVIGPLLRKRFFPYVHRALSALPAHAIILPCRRSERGRLNLVKQMQPRLCRLSERRSEQAFASISA